MELEDIKINNENKDTIILKPGQKYTSEPIKFDNTTIQKDDNVNIDKIDTTIKKQDKRKEFKGNPKWVKGVSANPNGRPKGTLSITSEIKKKLLEIPQGERQTYLEKLIEVIFDKAIKEKDERTIKNIWNYIDGLPKQSIDLEGNVNVKTYDWGKYKDNI